MHAQVDHLGRRLHRLIRLDRRRSRHFGDVGLRSRHVGAAHRQGDGMLARIARSSLYRWSIVVVELDIVGVIVEGDVLVRGRRMVVFGVIVSRWGWTSRCSTTRTSGCSTSATT